MRSNAPEEKRDERGLKRAKSKRTITEITEHIWSRDAPRWLARESSRCRRVPRRTSVDA